MKMKCYEACNIILIILNAPIQSHNLSIISRYMFFFTVQFWRWNKLIYYKKSKKKFKICKRIISTVCQFMPIAATYVSKSVHFFLKSSTPLPPPNNFWIGSTLCLIWQTGIDLRCRCLILSDVCTVLPSWQVSLLWIRATKTLVIASQSTRVHTNSRHTLRTKQFLFAKWNPSILNIEFPWNQLKDPYLECWLRRI